MRKRFVSIWIIAFTLNFNIISVNAQQISKEDSLLKVFRKAIHDSSKVDILIQLVENTKCSDSEKINTYLNKIEGIVDDDHVKISPQKYIIIGELFKNYKNDLTIAGKYLELALQEAKNRKDHDWISIESSLGYNFIKTGDIEKAMFHLLNATQAAETGKNLKDLPKAYIMLAFGYRESNDISKAGLYFRKTIDASLKIKDSTYIHTALHEIGNIYYLNNDFNNAIVYHKKALAIREKLQEKSNLVYSYHDIALDYQKIDSFKISLLYYKKAEKIAEQIGDKWLIFNMCKSIFSNYKDTKDKKNAALYLNKMQNLAEQLNIKSAYYLLYFSYYRFYSLTKQFEKALYAYEKANIYNDSILNDETKKNILELDKKYETAKKDKELIKIQENNKRQKIIIWFSVISSFVFILLLIIVFRQFRQKKAANIKLEFQNQEISKQKEEIQTQAENLQKINNQLHEQNDKIEFQNVQLTELNATKDKFFSILAHDLRNPFNSLIGMSDLLKMSAYKLTPENVEKYAETMNSSSRQAYNLLENLLEWSRIQTGKLIPTFSNVLPSSIINEVVMLLEAPVHSKNIILLSDIIDDHQIVADREMTKTVIRNLTTNALKFTFPEGIIKIECQKSGNEMMFSVSDTGIGIEAEHIDKLFRIDSNLSKKGTANEKGTGLGLILCKEFVEKQHGRIWAESEPGKGSCFRFTIPLSSET